MSVKEQLNFAFQSGTLQDDDDALPDGMKMVENLHHLIKVEKHLLRSDSHLAGFSALSISDQGANGGANLLIPRLNRDPHANVLEIKMALEVAEYVSEHGGPRLEKLARDTIESVAQCLHQHYGRNDHPSKGQYDPPFEKGKPLHEVSRIEGQWLPSLPCFGFQD